MYLSDSNLITVSGRIFLIPVTLGGDQYSQVIPEAVLVLTRSLRFFVVEEIRSARRFLRMIDKGFPIDNSVFFLLNEHTPESEIGIWVHLGCTLSHHSFSYIRRIEFLVKNSGGGDRNPDLAAFLGRRGPPNCRTQYL